MAKDCLYGIRQVSDQIIRFETGFTLKDFFVVAETRFSQIFSKILVQSQNTLSFDPLQYKILGAQLKQYNEKQQIVGFWCFIN